MMVLIFFLAFYYYIVVTSEKISTLNQQELADKTIKQVEYYLNDADNIAYQVMTNSYILNAFNKLQQDQNSSNYFDKDLLANIDIGSILTTINGPKRTAWRISVYNQYGDHLSSGALTDVKNVKEVLRREDIALQMRTLMLKQNRNLILPPMKDKWSDDYSSSYVTIKRPLMNIYSREVYGIVEVQQDIKTLIEGIEFDVMESIGITITDEGGEVVFDNSDKGIREKMHNKVYKTSNEFGWTVTLSQSRYDMLSPYRVLIITVFIGSVAVVLLMIIAVIIIAQRLGKPVVMLKDTVSKLSMENIGESYTSDDSIDEVRELNKAFSAMLNRLNESITLEKRAWFLALQAQMNPHFLYNSLSIISAAAIEAGNDKIVTMCQELSAMLRYIASYKETTVTLKEEINNVTNYLNLMKWRYEDYFSYEIALDYRLASMSVPKLILQPLAENCFAHAFSETEPPYWVKIEAGIEEDKWYIKVYDNGCGLSEEGKRSLQDKIEVYSKGNQDKYTQMKIGGLGLVNTLIRMKLNKNKGIDYSIEDNEPCGLIITMRGELE